MMMFPSIYNNDLFDDLFDFPAGPGTEKLRNNAHKMRSALS